MGPTYSGINQEEGRAKEAGWPEEAGEGGSWPGPCQLGFTTYLFPKQAGEEWGGGLPRGEMEFGLGGLHSVCF